ncbi:MAG TPA: phytoene/squalene synthase family protein [Pseudonocardiaceae bacterium]|jgi:phytoene synthase|nr:phytoene/squalene synthase family protein [Pseudonocardiaceae bacterium]
MDQIAHRRRRTVNVADAYAECERITTQQARNFSYGIKLLSTPRRAALSAVYAFARRVDDIGDSADPAQERLRGLTEVRAQLHTLDQPGDDPVLIALADTAQRTALPVPAFDELIDGCEDDVRGVSYATFDDLRHYCRCVAGSIGRLSLGVFGCHDRETAAPLADALGVALQLTNILRDVLEDRGNGRIYLPAEDLAQFGCTFELDERGRFTDDEDALTALIEFEAARAQDWYDTGLRLLPVLDGRSRACCAAMAGIYQRLLERIMARPWLVLASRMSLPGWEKASVAVRSLAGAAR